MRDAERGGSDLTPSPPDPGVVGLAPCLALAASALGVLLPDRAPLERLAALALVGCAVLAVAWHRRDRSHGPVRSGLVATAAIDSVNAGLRDFVLTGGPYAGFLRSVFHAHEALTLASIAALPLVAGAVLLRGRRWRLLRTCVVVGALGMLAALVDGYAVVRNLPVEARGEWLRLRYLVAELLSLFATCAVVWRARRARGRPSTPAEQTVACLLVGGLALLLVGSWERGLFGPAYSVHQAGLAAMYLVVALVHARALRGDGRPGT